MTDEQITIGSLDQTREALAELLLQALQSDVNSAANEWGLQAIVKARAVLGGQWSLPPAEHVRGEPTGYLVKRYDLDGVLLDTELSFTKPVIRSTAKTEFEPLYKTGAAPAELSVPTTWGIFTLDGRFTNLVGENEEDAQLTGEDYFTKDFIVRPLYEQPSTAEQGARSEAEFMRKTSIANARQRNAAERRIQQLEAALKPFADFIEGTSDWWDDERRIASLSFDFDKLKLGLFRAARSVISASEVER